MVKGEVDGAWVPEPWGARLDREAGASIFLDERDLWQGGQFATSLIICKSDYVENNPQAARALIGAHVDKTLWINEHKEEAIAQFNEHVAEILGAEFDERDLRASLARMEFTYDPLEETVARSAQDAYALDLLDEEPDLQGMFNLEILNDVLLERGLDSI
jgi:NitT/TauT family transport system substrate-binding protein